MLPRKSAGCASEAQARANTLGNTIGNTIGNSIGNPIGNSIGNSIKKSGFSRYPFYNHFEFYITIFKKNSNAILKITSIRSTYTTDQPKFIEKIQNGK